LVETAFISNPDEEARLSDKTYQDKIANAVFRGLRAHLIKNPPPPKVIS
jgi:N-acetylmuramoyl-L-alanine amidase